MERQITDIMEWFMVDSPAGTDYFPMDMFSTNDIISMYQNVSIDLTITYGYGARLSSPGYYDCTDWCVFDTEAEAEEYLDFLQGDY